jgi:hypothetical protein
MQLNSSRFFETSGTTHPTTQRHIQEDLNPRKSRSENTEPSRFIINQAADLEEPGTGHQSSVFRVWHTFVFVLPVKSKAGFFKTPQELRV